MSFLSNYWTVRYTAIQDYRLGFSYWIGSSAIILLTLYELVAKQGYLELCEVDGFVLPRLKSALEVSDLQRFEYCRQETKTSCRLWDALEASSAEDGEIFIATRVQQEKQVSACQGEDCRAGFQTVEKTSFYLAGVENFTLQVTANIQAYRFRKEDAFGGHRYFGQHSHMDGVLMASDGQTPLRALPKTGSKDKIQIWELLHASGLHLDMKTDALNIKDDHDTFRDEGSVLLVSLEYDNKESITLFSWLMGERGQLTYRMHIEHLPGSEYKKYSIIDRQTLDDGTQMRTEQKLHGLLVKFQQVGAFGRVSVAAIIKHLLVGFGTLTVMTTVLDAAWNYLFPIFGIDYCDAVYSYCAARIDQMTDSKNVKAE
ncbi:hypothetical protein CYMTET_24213 [Cymbomonas tetramitiformis]|uniref:Uncharacterized protein n=1 Tax=Cymbomonas tetramitiformis TaxID=36881 RepID=A0AAE0FWL2_9CHLO|nr:hypothetical protein CYMTET_24213 [Cymbomonas tetramitiformis]